MYLAEVASWFINCENDFFYYQVPTTFGAFAGHFVGNPLLPGVCQFSICVDALARKESKKLEINKVIRCKFLKPILPELCVKVSVNRREDGQCSALILDKQTEEKISQITFAVKEL